MNSDKTNVVINTTAYRTVWFRDSRMDLYIPVNDIGVPSAISKSVRLECWELRDEVRDFNIGLNIGQLSLALVRSNDGGDFAPLAHWIAHRTLRHYSEWRDHLHRASDKDIHSYEVVLK